jgi:hypothetical protein
MLLLSGAVMAARVLEICTAGVTTDFHRKGC